MSRDDNVDESPGFVSGNVTRGNTGHGLAIIDQIPENGPFYTVAFNLSNRNGGLGITTNLTGVIDGGCNRARHNGDPVQCKGVLCG